MLRNTSSAERKPDLCIPVSNLTHRFPIQKNIDGKITPKTDEIAERRKYAAYKHDLGNPLFIISNAFYLFSYEIQNIKDLSTIFNFENLQALSIQLNSLAKLISLSFLENGENSFQKHGDNLEELEKQSIFSQQDSSEIQCFLKKLQQNDVSNIEIENYFKIVLEHLKVILNSILTKIRPIQNKFAKIVISNDEMSQASSQQLFDRLINKEIPEAIEIINAVLLLFNPKAKEEIKNITRRNEKNAIYYSVKEIVQAAIDSSEVVNRNHHKLIAKSLVETATIISCDRASFILALKNLINNAVKYTEKKAAQLKKQAILVIEAYDKPNYHVIAVIDNGPGIKETMQTKILEAGVSGSIKSTGAGLWMANTLISAHNGILGVNSEPNQGAVFYIILPKNDHPITENIIQDVNNWAKQKRIALQSS